MEPERIAEILAKFAQLDTNLELAGVEWTNGFPTHCCAMNRDCAACEFNAELESMWADIKELATLAAEATRYREALEGLVGECDKTIAWRRGGMRPATDTSAFASSSLSAVIQVRRTLSEVLATGQEG